MSLIQRLFIGYILLVSITMRAESLQESLPEEVADLFSLVHSNGAPIVALTAEGTIVVLSEHAKEYRASTKNQASVYGGLMSLGIGAFAWAWQTPSLSENERFGASTTQGIKYEPFMRTYNDKPYSVYWKVEFPYENNVLVAGSFIRGMALSFIGILSSAAAVSFGNNALLWLDHQTDDELQYQQWRNNKAILVELTPQGIYTNRDNIVTWEEFASFEMKPPSDSFMPGLIAWSKMPPKLEAMGGKFTQLMKLCKEHWTKHDVQNIEPILHKPGVIRKWAPWHYVAASGALLTAYLYKQVSRKSNEAHSLFWKIREQSEVVFKDNPEFATKWDAIVTEVIANYKSQLDGAKNGKDRIEIASKFLKEMKEKRLAFCKQFLQKKKPFETVLTDLGYTLKKQDTGITYHFLRDPSGQPVTWNN